MPSFTIKVMLVGIRHQMRVASVVGTAPPSTPPAAESLEIVSDVVSSLYLYLEVADEPGVLAGVAQLLAERGVSVTSVVQKGMSDQARLVMVVHPVLESRFGAAMDLIAALDSMPAPPRAIRVLAEEFG